MTYPHDQEQEEASESKGRVSGRIVSGRSDESLLEWAIRGAGNGAFRRRPRWAHVADLFGLGRTAAHKLCIRFNIDYDELVGGCSACDETYSTECRCGRLED